MGDSNREHEDIELFTRWRHGESHAGQTLVARYLPGVTRFFRGKLGDDVTEVSDLVQQTFLACLETTPAISHSFAALLYTIARARLCDHLRRKYRLPDHTPISAQSLYALSTGVATGLQHKQTHAKLLEALNQLPLDTRILLELTYWEGLAGPEVAAVLEIPANTVRSRLVRARQALRDLLQVDEPALVQTFSEFAGNA